MLIHKIAHLAQVMQRQHLAIVGIFKAHQPGLDEVGVIGGDGGPHVLKRQGTVGLHGNRLQSHRAQHGGSLRLVAIDVRGRAQHGPFSTLAVAHHRQQVGHGAGWHEQGRLLAQQLGTFVLERIDAGIFPIDIITHLGVQHALAHGLRGLGHGITS